MLPACGQGALGIECRSDDHTLHTLLNPLQDLTTTRCVTTERQVNALLGGHCHVPLAVYCEPISSTQLQLRALVASPDGQQVFFYQNQGEQINSSEMASICAENLLSQGAGRYLDPIY